MFIESQQAGRRFFLQVYEKLKSGLLLEPLEQLVAEVITNHPEYHPLLADEEAAMHAGSAADSGHGNPFLHMSLHIALREQLSIDRPAGVKAVFARLVAAGGDAHTAEHHMIECLASALWEAQQDNRVADEQAYIECLNRL